MSNGAPIKAIDLFAGPGGLGEGFSSVCNLEGHQPFKIVLSVEKDHFAHQTLMLRSFVRQFPKKEVPDEYYDHLRGKISQEELYQLYPMQAVQADEETWKAELGDYRRFSKQKIDERISDSLGGARDWVLIGGPPCQAYSLVGRSRVIPVDRREGTQKYQKDKRHFLYKAYLRILSKHAPPVFVMENVKGILSAEVSGRRIIDRLLTDLRHPVPAVKGENETANDGLEYEIYPLAVYSDAQKRLVTVSKPQPLDYIVRSEEHRIPQMRHRFILVGVRSDVAKRPRALRVYRDRVKMWMAIGDLPRLRSKRSHGQDSGAEWVDTIRRLADSDALRDPATDDGLYRAIIAKLDHLVPSLSPGNTFLNWEGRPQFQQDWFYDPRLRGVCNHVSRSHMDSDLRRYFYLACYAAVHGKSAGLTRFPAALLPNHENVKKVEREEIIFKDRFRVQLKNRPATTVTSHIGKDGHYFIHPDPLQCRSLTVREAARLQTFPDNYFFEGPITAQYQQVGNAVPPLLARQIAAIVYELFS